MVLNVRLKKCKICGSQFETSDSFRQWCSPECWVELAKQRTSKAKAKADKARDKLAREKIKKAKESLKSRSDWLNELQTWVNKFIRLRDKDEPCISCGRYHQGQWHAGHYRSRGACPELRFNEDNIHKQCSVCNNHKSGNAIDYRINLIKKIGIERVAFLERENHPPLKMSVEEIKAQIKVYKQKCKELTDAQI